MFKTILSFLFLLISCSVFGVENSRVEAILAQAHTQHLAQNPYWLALLHYRPNRLGSGMKSEVTTAEFFLSARGMVDAEAELDATLSAIFQLPHQDADEHAQCRFIARYQWLRKMLDWQNAPPAVECKRFNAWNKRGQVNSASLIFATGYFSNPASFYGHILLKFNADRAAVPTNLLDESLNFGAIVPDDENPVRYMFNGLFGFYDAAFSSTSFYRLSHTYAEEELRDMWEYELNLSPDELQQISAHSWELLQTKFDYYFFNKNCAYRMAELVSLVIGEPLLPDALPWSVPVSVFDHLMQLQHDGKPLVREVKRIPSRLNRYRDQYHQLAENQQQVVRDFVLQKTSLAQGNFLKLSTEKRIAVVDTLRDYYQFLLITDKENIEYKTRRRDLLLMRAELPEMDTQAQLAALSEKVVVPPHLGAPPGLIRPALLHNNRLGAGMSVQLRPVYFDHLENDVGHVAYADLSMFDLTLHHFGNRWQVRQLDLVNIQHLNLADTPLPGDGGWAWRIKFGAQQAHLACTNCTLGQLNGGLGKAVRVGDMAVVYALLGGTWQSAYQQVGTVSLSPEIGVQATLLEGWKTSLVLVRRDDLNAGRAQTTQAQWENRFGVARDWDVRLNYRHNVASEWQAAISTYW